MFKRLNHVQHLAVSRRSVATDARRKSAITRTGRAEQSGGCTKSRWRLSRNSLAAATIERRSHLLHKRVPETSRVRLLGNRSASPLNPTGSVVTELQRSGGFDRHVPSCLGNCTIPDTIWLVPAVEGPQCSILIQSKCGVECNESFRRKRGSDSACPEIKCQIGR